MLNNNSLSVLKRELLIGVSVKIHPVYV